jgi:hypothetical protein
MPRPKKNISENTDNKQLDELINKMKTMYPEQKELIDKIVVDSSKTQKNTFKSATIITDKIGEYYYDDYGGIWNSNFEWIGSHHNKSYFFNDIKKIKEKICKKLN